MGKSFFLLRKGQPAPATKSLDNTAFNLLVDAKVNIPAIANIYPIAGYRFAIDLEAAAGSPVTETLVRHNKEYINVSNGAYWDDAKETVKCVNSGRQGSTAEVQLAGAFFKYQLPAKTKLGILASGANAATDVLKVFVSFFTRQDQNSALVASNPNSGVGGIEGYEITADAFVFKHDEQIVMSYPRTYSATLSAGTFSKNNTATITNVSYTETQQVNIPTPGVFVRDITLSLTDDLTTRNEVIPITAFAPLTSQNQDFEFTVGQDINFDVLTLVNHARTNIDNAIVVSGIMPQGIVLNNGILSGKFETDGNNFIKILVTDKAGQTATIEMNFKVNPAANVSFDLPPASKTKDYNFVPRLPAGFESISLDSPLPAGLNLNPQTGQFYGKVLSTVTNGIKKVKLSVRINGATEKLEIPITVYSPLQSQYLDEDNNRFVLDETKQSKVNRDDLISLALQGGSGSYRISANNGAIVNYNNQVQFLNSGKTTVTVIDSATREQTNYTFLVSGQDSIVAFGVVQQADTTVQKNRPLVVEVGRQINVGFSRWTIVDFDSNRLLRMQPLNIRNVNAIAEGTAFALFTSQTNDAKIQMPRSGNFFTGMALDEQLITMPGDFIIGLGRIDDQELKYAVALTTVNGERKAELRIDGQVVQSTRVSVATGQVLKVASINERFGMYLDGALQSVIDGEQLDYWDFIVQIKNQNISVGGQITGLTYYLTTPGMAKAVGSIHPQTGLYVPSDSNVPTVAVEGRLEKPGQAAPTAIYKVDIVVIRGTVIESFNKAKIQNKPLKIFIADIARGDNKRLRFTSDGLPDANQIKNAVYVGKLQASGKWDATEKRNDFSNDTGVYDTGYTLTKYTITGNVLNVANPKIVKTLVPFVEVHDEEIGSLSFSQKANGCIPETRTIIVWESGSCNDEGEMVWDAIEFHNTKSFTPFNWEIGSDVATMLAMSIEAYPEESTNRLWTFYRYDSQFVEV